jgi:serine/threonine protein kinase/outer membrane protein assembly factor BamB
MQLLAPSDPRQAGEFRLSARLGVGGMGRVFLGYSPAGRAVAVKVCHPDLAADPAFVQRFAREVTAAQAVNGLYTAQVVGAGPYDKPPWMATTFVPGPSLADYVEGFGPLPEPAAWRLAAGLAEALLAVHAAGLVHRDLKPSNVLLAVDGPRVIDFGIASALENTGLTNTGLTNTGLTTTGSVMGSPSYMAPEQAMGTPAGQASDVFALGSTLAFAAAGVPPFGHGDAPAVLFRVVHMPPAIESLPERLRAVVAACLAKEPAARPTLPQLLRAGRDAAAAGGNSAASFWPGQMTAVIAEFEADQARPLATPPNGSGSYGSGSHGSGSNGSGSHPGGPHPQTELASPGAPPRGAPTRQTALGRAGTTVATAIGRRRVLSGFGGLIVAGGLAAAGWELAKGGGGTAAAATGDTADHRVAWTYKAGAPVRTGAAISTDGTQLYIGSDNGKVYALDAANGKATGTYPTGGGAVSGVAMAGTTLLAGSVNGKVYAFDTGGDGQSWTSPAAGAAINGAPTSGGGMVYAGSEDHHLYAFSYTTGQLKWRAKTGGATVAGAALGTGEVWVSSTDGYLYVLSTSNGAVDARFPAGGAIDAAPLAALGPVFFGAADGALYSVSYDDITGSIVNWHFTAGGAIQGTPASDGDTIYAATAKDTVYAVGRDSGTGLWTCPVGGPVRGGPAVSGGVLYVGCDDGYLYAIDISQGTVSWKFKAGGAISGSVLTAGSLVYFGSLDGHVYALHA